MKSVAEAIKQVLLCADPREKVMLARSVNRRWKQGRLDWRFDCSMPDRPARPDKPELLHPAKMPARKGGSLTNRIALLHALAHIEFSAIDLAFDMAGRFGEAMPRTFMDDWLGVGADEALHFALLNRRLRDLGSYYGALAAHDGCGRPPNQRQATFWRDWRLFRWFWRLVDWMSVRQPSRV